MTAQDIGHFRRNSIKTDIVDGQFMINRSNVIKKRSLPDYDGPADKHDDIELLFY